MFKLKIDKSVIHRFNNDDSSHLFDLIISFEQRYIGVQKLIESFNASCVQKSFIQKNEWKNIWELSIPLIGVAILIDCSSSEAEY